MTHSREWHDHQCQKAGKVQDANGIWWCGQHDPEAVKRREEKRSEKFEAEWKANNRKWALQFAAPKFRDALRLIANGHNDPRSLAVQVLGDMLEPDE